MNNNQKAVVWDDTSSEHRVGSLSVANKVLRLSKGQDGMEALRCIFPDGEADDMNFVFFSTGGVHGLPTSIEKYEGLCDIEQRAAGITFLIVNPRIAGLRYGNVYPVTELDFAFLKKLRASSHKTTQTIGTDKESKDE
jgi:hypothetical protein